MLKPYIALLRTPGAVAFSGAGFVARLPISMLGLSIVLLVSARQGSYQTAGLVSATCSLAGAIGSPRVARLVDRRGQARVALPATLILVAAGLLLVACAETHAPTWTLFVTAAVAGAAGPNIGSLVRARWSALLGRSASLDTAFSLESTIDELIFIIGPTLATMLATGVAPSAGLFAALGIAFIGMVALAVQRSTEPPPTPPPAAHHRREAFFSPGMLVVILACTCIGGIFGSIEIVTVAFAGDRHHRAAAGLILAAFAFGSCLAGFLIGARRIRMPLHRRFLIGTLALPAVMAPLLAANSMVELAVLIFIAGLAVSPTMISGIGLVELLVPPSRLTEGFTWVSASLALGMTAGSSLGGWAADHAGTPGAYGVAVWSGVVGAVVVLAGVGALRGRSDLAADAADTADTQRLQRERGALPGPRDRPPTRPLLRRAATTPSRSP